MLPAVTITWPVDGSFNVPTNSPLEWTGPAGFEAIGAEVHGPSGNGVGTALPGTATSWPSPPKLTPGTNDFQVQYITSNVPLITFSRPVDANANPVHGWIAAAHLRTEAISHFVVTDTGAPAAVTLVAPRLNGASFEFKFASQPGFTYIVQYRANLSSGPDWQTYSTVPGDGTLKTILVPLSVFNSARQGFVRVLTQ